MGAHGARADQPDGGTAALLLPLTEPAAEGRVVDRLVDVAVAQPDAPAVSDGHRVLTFGRLLVGAAAVAEQVSALNPERGPVAVLRGHDAGAVVAIAGVIGSGAPLVVLDPTTPAIRLRHYVEAAGAVLCISDADRAATAAEVCPTVIDPGLGSAEDGPVGVDALREAARVLAACPSTPTDPLVIVYTSGSTGRPKGVACDSRSVLHDAWTNAVATDCYGAGDVVANLLPMAFSAGIGLTLTALLVGSSQQLFDPRTRPVSQLATWLREVGATVLVGSPAIVRGAVAALGPGERLEGLSVLTMAGETVHGAELSAARRAVGEHCQVRNRYGSTETWLIAEHILDPEDPSPTGATPVGRPVGGVRVQVQDERGELHDRGTGRLVVSSRWLSSGYWGEPELTAAVFTDLGHGVRRYLTSDTATIDDDGRVHLLGRTDHSVKIRGNLVEPGEVDAVLFAQPEIAEAVVAGVVDDSTGRARLVAYVVPAVPRLQASSVRRVVREALPSYMVPQDVVFLEALPRTERGKLDRSALPPAPPASNGGAPPRTDWERVVAGVFARVLELDEIGIDEDFFALGGDSLAAEALLAALGQELGIDDDALSTALLVSSPTVATFAAAVRKRRHPPHPTLVTLRSTGARRPLFCVAGAGGVALGFGPLAKRLPEQQPVLALQAHGMENRGFPDWSVEAMARRHLRTIRSVQAEGPYRLAGHSLGGVIALEMAHQLRSAGQEVDLLVVLDSFPPEPGLAPSPLSGGPLERLKQVMGLLTTGVLPDRLGQYLRFHRQGMALQRRYRTSPWDGRTLVLVAQDDAAAAERSMWGPHLTGRWSMRRVPGDHVGMLVEPNVAHAADAIAVELLALDGAEADEAHREAQRAVG